MVMDSLDDTIIRQMCEAIVCVEDPRCVVLIGSYASGRAHPGSDVDLLVVTRKDFNEGRTRRKVTSSIRRALSRFRVPKDILVYSPSELEKWQNSKNHIIYTGLREGRMLYERPQPRATDAIDGA